MTAFARVSSLVRSLTGMIIVTAPSVARTRPMSWASRVAKDTNSEPLDPLRSRAQESQVSRSQNAVTDGVTIGSSAPSDTVGGLPGWPAAPVSRLSTMRINASRARKTSGNPRRASHRSTSRPSIRPRDPGGGYPKSRVMPLMASKTARPPATPSTTEWVMTTLTAVPPSCSGRTPKCQQGPYSGSTGICARSSNHAVISLRGRGVAATSMSGASW